VARDVTNPVPHHLFGLLGLPLAAR
jgi:hypothetical protein